MESEYLGDYAMPGRLMLVIVVATNCLAILASAAEPANEEQPVPNEFWAKAIEFAKVPVDKIDKFSGDYWVGKGALPGSDAFLTLAAPLESRDEVIKQYIAGYGRYGYRADMFAALSFPELFAGIRPDFDEKRFPAPWIPVEYFQIREKVFEQMVRRSAKDSSARARFYHLTMWIGFQLNVSSFGPSTLAKQTLKGWGDKEEKHYWWWARNFVLLAHSTNREDLLESAKPDDLRPAFHKWHDWCHAAERRFVPVPDKYRWKEACDTDRTVGDARDWLEMPPPKYPFPDWDPSVPVPDKSFFRDYISFDGLRKAVNKTKK